MSRAHRAGALLAAIVLAVIAPAPAAERNLTLDLGGGVGLELILVDPGTFEQGSPADEAGRGADEAQRTVTLTRPFYLGKHPVTRAQFERFVAETGYRTEAEQGTSGGFGWEGGKLVQKKQYTWRQPGFPQDGTHPVTLVTWFDARKFAEWLSRRTERAISLPTEAQWEYACRAGNPGPWPGGAADDAAWHAGNSPGGTQPVGRKAANAWGFHDLQGSVWEWCEDWYGPYPPGAATDPLQTNDALSDRPRRVLRGGAFTKQSAACRAAARYRNDPRSRNADNGFRVLTMTIDRPLPVLEHPDPQPRTGTAAAPAAAELPRSPAPLPAPAPAEPAERSVAGVLIPLALGVLGILFLVWMARRDRGTAPHGHRRDRGGRGSGPAGETGQTRIVDDGFWLRADAPPGTQVRWRCRIGGGWREGTVSYDPGRDGQFIFTGSRPEAVDAQVIGFAAGMLGAALAGPPPTSPPPLPDREREARERRERERRRRSAYE